MQLDRRWVFRSGLGTGLGLLAAAATASRANADPRRPATAPSTPAAAPPPSHTIPASSLGLRPDTGRDETASLQAAIDKAAARNARLLLDPGRYLVRSIRLAPGARLAGAGRSTILQHLGGPPLIVGDELTAPHLSGLTLTGGFPLAAGARALIELRGCRDIHIEAIGIETAPAGGIHVERCSGRITRCRITGVERTGIMSLDSTGGLEITHNELTRIGNNAIQVWRSTKGEDGSIVAHNRISHVAARAGGTGENGNAINVFRAGSVSVSSNRITDCAFSAVRANSASNVMITGNHAERMGEVAIFVEFAFDGAVVSGNLVDSASAGVSVTNFDHGGRLAVVSANLIRNVILHRGPSDPGGYGIAVEADASVTGNTIERCPTAGIQAGWGRFARDIAVSGNVVRGSAIGIAISDDPRAGTILVANNLISGSSNGAIRATDHGRPTSTDLALQPPARGRIVVTGNVAT